MVVTAVIDRFAHLGQYHQWAKDPYHYCLAVLIERYVMWLGSRTGDVMAESRGRKEDMRLKEEFDGQKGQWGLSCCGAGRASSACPRAIA